MEFGSGKISLWLLLVSSTSCHSFSSTRCDECDLCPSCSVCTNRGMACALLRVLPFLLHSHSPVCCSCFLLLHQLLHLFHLSSHPHLLPDRSTLALHNILHSHCCTSSWSYMFVCDTRVTHCPCQLKTGSVSSSHTNMSRCSRPP